MNTESWEKPKHCAAIKEPHHLAIVLLKEAFVCSVSTGCNII